MARSDTKALIIEKATDLFYRHGYVKASIRDIVKAVGITNSTVYIHFRNKDEILYTIINEVGKALLEELRAAIRENEDPVTCLREMVFRQICLMNDKKKEIKIYMEEQYQLPTSLRKEALKQHRQIYDLYKNIIKKLAERRLLRPIDETVMTFSIFAMMNWSYRWFKENGRLSIEEVAEDIIEIFFGGIFRENPLNERHFAKE